ncbi:GNAT family N-acetyltransferase [Streptomyces sp. DH12]|uniref:GNAT family N-acetyltransferase n=1 Tax=Streptomyces sp. DH12 TaxID=2857010 RepID=UPI001E2DDCF9|nr:GNAT family N-acetyltransferase [Streptomyces sp. DH12]
MTVEFSQATAEHLQVIKQEILDIHIEVRYRDFGMTGEFHSAKRFAERLEMYASRPGWSAVIAHEEGAPVGFCFGHPLAADTKWWATMTTPLAADVTREDGSRTVALNEIVVRRPWRGSGTAWQLHETWLMAREEERVTLLVNPASGNGALQANYEAWGYRKIGEQKPFADSPVYSVMLRPIAQNA